MSKNAFWVVARLPQRLKSMFFERLKSTFFEILFLHSAGSFGASQIEKFLKTLILAFEANSASSCSEIRKKVQFQKYNNTLFAFSKMAKNPFLHQKKVRKLYFS